MSEPRDVEVLLDKLEAMRLRRVLENVALKNHATLREVLGEDRCMRVREARYAVVDYLRALRWSWADIAKAIGRSGHTVYRSKHVRARRAG